MDYLILKWLHVLSSTVLFGTGIGSAFFLLFTSLSRDVRAIASVTRYVVIADWLFTATTAILQPLTGFWMVMQAGLPLSLPWLSWSIGLYVVAIACWLPVVWLQIRMRDLAQEAASGDTVLPPAYWRFLRIWVALGAVAFICFMLIFYLMIMKRF